MKKTLIIALIILCALPSAAAQRRKKVKEPEISPEELARIELYNMRVRATEKVTFIDSIVVSKENLMKNLSLSTEAGSVALADEYYQRTDCGEATVFVSQLGNMCISAQKVAERLRLFSSYKLGTEWTTPQPLAGLGEDNEAENYPFMLSDGVTLYFAAMNDDCVGGYDIFMTRYDSDGHRFLAPENIGMPFNSEANDYLYVIDEFNHLGWFVTDRNQPQDSVCIYTFIPSTTRQTYDIDEIDEETLKSYAMLNSIRQTQTDTEEVSKALKRLSAMKEESRRTHQRDFTFALNDRLTYTTLQQFKTENGRRMAQQWAEKCRQLTEITAALADLRTQYASNPGKRQQLTSAILEKERAEEVLISEISFLEKEIRKAEQKK